MTSRREFLKEAAAGAVILGSESTLAMAAPDKDMGKSRIVVVHDNALRGASSEVPEETRVAAILDRAMETYFQQKTAVAPWKQLVRPGQVVSLKVNTIAGKGLSTHVSLVNAICERLQQAGIKPGNIIVWDRTNHELEAAGFKIATDTNHVRCFGTDAVGYAKTQLSKIVTQSEVIINVPVLKHHGMAGVTMAMKNMYGAIKNPRDQHGNNCNPYVADLNALPELRRKVRFIVGDIFTSIYDRGPGFKPEYTWQQNQLMVGEDRVAMDYLGWQIIEKKRAEKGLKSLENSNSAPRYIATAADSQHKLGTSDPARISLTAISM
jgi:hypothetical protein